MAWGRPLTALALGLLLTSVAFKVIALVGRFAINADARAPWRVRAVIADQVRGSFSVVRYAGLLAVAFIVGDTVTLTTAQQASALLLGFWLFRIADATIRLAWERMVLNRPDRHAWRWRGVLLNLAPMGLSVAFVGLLPTRYDVLGLAWLSAGVLALLFLHSSWALWFLQRTFLRVARPVCVEAVARAAEAQCLPVPLVFEVAGPHLNAFALIQAGAVGFTEDAVDLLGPDELQVIAAHELGHLRESPRVRRLRLFFGLRPLALVAFFPLLDLKRALFCGLLLWWLMGLVQRLLSRWAERQADAVAAAQQSEWELYARMLVRLHELNLSSGETATSHPALAERLAAAGLESKRPRRRRGSTIGSVGLAIGIATFVVLQFAAGAGRNQVALPQGNEASAARFLATRGDAAGLVGVGSYFAERGQLDRAELALLAAYSGRAPVEAMLLGLGLRARRGECKHARSVVKLALNRCEIKDDCELMADQRCWSEKSSSICAQLAKQELAAYFQHCPTPARQTPRGD